MAVRYRTPYRRQITYVLAENLFPTKIHGLEVSYNPETERFFIHADDDDKTTIATLQASQENWRNVVQTCRRLSQRLRDADPDRQADTTTSYPLAERVTPTSNGAG